MSCRPNERDSAALVVLALVVLALLGCQHSARDRAIEEYLRDTPVVLEGAAPVASLSLEERTEWFRARDRTLKLGRDLRGQ